MNHEKARDLIARNKWTFAKTMPQIPHEYTLRKNWNSEKEFVALVLYIREVGRQEKFGRTTYTYLYLDGYKYWTMGAHIDITTLINRAKA
jgi:hypothetical protein